MLAGALARPAARCCCSALGRYRGPRPSGTPWPAAAYRRCNTYRARGVLPDSAAEAAGLVTGGTMEWPLLNAADLVIGLGVDEAEMIPASWDYAARTVLVTQPGTAPAGRLVLHRLATMGDALPAAIAAALCAPRVPVVAFTGDGGLGMTLAEIETAVRLSVRVIVIVSTTPPTVEGAGSPAHARHLPADEPGERLPLAQPQTVVKREVSEDDPADGQRVTDQLDRIWVKYTGNEPPYALRDPLMDERRVLFELEVVKVATFGQP